MGLYSVAFVAVIIACFLVLCPSARYVGRFLYLTSKIPGPSLWQLLTVHAKHLLDDDMITYIWKMCAMYDYKPWGTWLGNVGYVVIVSDCESVSAVYKSKSMTDKTSSFYGLISEYLGESLLTMNGPEYPRHRKIFGFGLRKSLQDHFLRSMPKHMSEFTEALRQIAADGKDLDLRRLITWHVIDAMAASFTSCTHADAPWILENLVDNLPRRLELLHMKTVNPVYYWLFVHFRKSSKQNKTLVLDAMKGFHDIFLDEKSRAINDTTNDSEYAQDIFQAFIKSYLSITNNERANDKELCAIGLTLVVTSFETTSFVLNILLLVLALHQNVQQRVLDEIDSVLDMEKTVLGDDLERLQYMEMVIYETLRLFPAGPILLRKVHQESNLNGLLVPAGSIVMINAMALHRNPEYFPDPLKFDPSRFSSEASKGRRRYSYIPFSAGYRGCPGQLHAFVMMKLMLCQILKNFRILPGEKLKSMDDIKVKMFVTMHLEESSLRLLNRSSEKA